MLYMFLRPLYLYFRTRLIQDWECFWENLKFGALQKTRRGKGMIQITSISLKTAQQKSPDAKMWSLKYCRDIRDALGKQLSEKQKNEDVYLMQL
jgi:hypothetical protein